MALDWEVGHPDPVGWCTTFVNRVHDTTGVWPLLYINLSTLRSYDWSPVLNNCGLWVAAWGVDPENDLNTGGRPYVMHQYQGSPLDRDAWFGSIEQFNAYGYHAVQPAPAPPTEVPSVPTPSQAPAPSPQPAPVPEPVPVPSNPAPAPTPSPPPVVVVDTPKVSWLDKLIQKFLTFVLELLSRL
jgi:hypothetical protein